MRFPVVSRYSVLSSKILSWPFSWFLFHMIFISSFSLTEEVPHCSFLFTLGVAILLSFTETHSTLFFIFFNYDISKLFNAPGIHPVMNAMLKIIRARKPRGSASDKREESHNASMSSTFKQLWIDGYITFACMSLKILSMTWHKPALVWLKCFSWKRQCHIYKSF